MLIFVLGMMKCLKIPAAFKVFQNKLWLREWMNQHVYAFTLSILWVFSINKWMFIIAKGLIQNIINHSDYWARNLGFRYKNDIPNCLEITNDVNNLVQHSTKGTFLIWLSSWISLLSQSTQLVKLNIERTNWVFHNKISRFVPHFMDNKFTSVGTLTFKHSYQSNNW